MKSNAAWGFTNANGEDLYPWPKDNYEYIGINDKKNKGGKRLCGYYVLGVLLITWLYWMLGRLISP